MREDLLKDWGEILERWDGKDRARPSRVTKLCRKVRAAGKRRGRGGGGKEEVEGGGGGRGGREGGREWDEREGRRWCRRGIVSAKPCSRLLFGE